MIGFPLYHIHSSSGFKHGVAAAREIQGLYCIRLFLVCINSFRCQYCLTRFFCGAHMYSSNMHTREYIYSI